jgi:hypothetical protein
VAFLITALDVNLFCWPMIGAGKHFTHWKLDNRVLIFHNSEVRKVLIRLIPITVTSSLLGPHHSFIQGLARKFGRRGLI